MDKLADKVVELIKDYRNDDGIQIDRAHVLRWIHQFDKVDREFLLTEIIHILPKSYLKKQDVIETLETVFEYLRNAYQCKTIQEFLNNSKFLSCQGSLKSQSILLDFLNKISLEKYEVSIMQSEKNKAKRWIYFDDVLASGGTFKYNFKDKINEYGKEEYIKDKIKFICIFFFLHDWGLSNAKYGLEQELSKEIVATIDFHNAFLIQNNPRINFYNPNPSFNHAFPIKNAVGKDFIDQLEEKLNLGYSMKNEAFAFRPKDRPTSETFYTSSENRNRYENIILEKGIEIFNNIEHISAKGIRPLGFTPPSYKTLGTGSHAFTWRNISNTCPLVYWWEVNSWYPLFSVQNRGCN